MVTALPQFLVTVADRMLRGQAGSVVIPAGPFKRLGFVYRIVTLINTSTVAALAA